MEDRCVMCGDIIPEGRHVCPICNREYGEPPALSRRDNKTPICPECGVREAIAIAGAAVGANEKKIKGESDRIIEIMRQRAGGVKHG